ncbi:GTPase Era, partial [Candidatus Uhrbacteria bacterium CG_4_10_14_0_2_um_filter_41_7]
KTDSYESRDCIDFYRDLASDFSGVVEISAKTGSNQDKVIKWILENLPEGDYMYPDFQVSNMTNEEQIGEIIREKLFLRLREEVPYTTEVEVHKVEEQKNGVLRIEADILTTEERYKRMIIGKGGQGIKEIGQSSRKELESMTSKKVYLDLNVKVDPHWVSRMD